MKARRHSVADQTEPNAVQFGPSAGKSSDARFRSPTTKAPKPRKASAGEKSIHLWAASRPGHRQSHSLRQQSHPARFVAGAGNLWRASTHKGSPLFRRRAPARNTLGPRGLLTARAAARRQEAPRDRGKAHRSREWRRARFVGAMTFSPRRPMAGRRGAHTVAEGDARFGVPRGAGRLPRRQ